MPLPSTFEIFTSISGGSTLPSTSALTVANTEIFSLSGPRVAFYAVSPRFVITLHFDSFP